MPFQRSLLVYRGMAYLTGVVLLAGTIGLIAQWAGADSVKGLMVVLWTAHGYLYLIYLITVLNLGIRMRWSVLRIVLVGVAGTIPTMSFVAEHFATRYVRAQQQAALARPDGLSR